MAQSDGRHKLKRMEFEFKGQRFRFHINPQEFNQSEPSRSTVTQTKGGAWVDDFGGGLPTIYIKGTSGFQKGKGVERFKELRNLIRKYYRNDNPGEEVTDEIKFHNFTDGESWVVHTDTDGFKLLRSKSSPLQYGYEIQLVCLRPASMPNYVPEVVVNTTLGSPFYGKDKVNLNRVELAAPYLRQELGINSPISKTLFDYLLPLETLNDGTVKNFQPVSYSGGLIEPKVTPTVSQGAIDTLRKVKTRKIEIQRKRLSENLLIYKLNELDKRYVPKNIKLIFRASILELLTVILELENNESDFSSQVSSEDLKRLIENLRWAVDEFSKSSEPDFDIIDRFQWGERALKYLLNSHLFGEDIQEKLLHLKQSAN